MERKKDEEEKRSGPSFGAILGGLALAGGAFVAGWIANKMLNEESNKEEPEPVHAKVEVQVPKEPQTITEHSLNELILDPITLEIMKDPVITPSGTTYDRKTIEGCIE